MGGEKISKLDQLLHKYIGGKKIIKTEVSRLTAPGENYGSILYKVDITLENDDKSREELHTVAKTLPQDEFFRKMFNIQVTCKTEIAFYDTVVPTLQRFAEEGGLRGRMDIFPRMYGGRINLNGSDVVDDDAVLLLENLKSEGRYLQNNVFFLG